MTLVIHWSGGVRFEYTSAQKQWITSAIASPWREYIIQDHTVALFATKCELLYNISDVFLESLFSFKPETFC